MKALPITKQRTRRILRSTALRPRSNVPKYNIKRAPKTPHLKKKKKEGNFCPRISKLKLLTNKTRTEILTRIHYHEEKLTKLQELGFPIISFDEGKIQQFIQKNQNKITLHDEEHIMKIIGIVGESYIEDPEPESNEYFVIQKKVIQMLINNDIFLSWDQDKWNSIIQQSLTKLPYHRNISNRNFTNQQRYRQMFTTLNHIYHSNLNYAFIKSCPFQGKSDLEELTNSVDLHNVRAIRSYLNRVMASLEKICAHKLNIENINLSELFKLQTTLQNDIEDYWLIKQNIFTVNTNKQKKIDLPPVKKPVQKQGQGTLLQYFKVVKKDPNDQGKEKQVKQQ